MKLNFDNPGEEARIEILPLIDVIFCILTFFILGAVSLTRQSAIGVDLPSAGTGTPQMREMLLVSLDPIGQLYLDRQVVTRQDLEDILIAEYRANPRKLTVLYASRSAKYDDVVGILDLLREIGGDVALATQPKPGEETDPLEPFPGLLEPNFDFDSDGSLGPDLTLPRTPLLPGDDTLSPLPSGSSNNSSGSTTDDLPFPSFSGDDSLPTTPSNGNSSDN
ncbi:MAG: biopolymer transporter ExbD [Cyanobacteria bacterium P01_F01_bin.150]